MLIYKIAPLHRRINNRLRRMIPPGQLIWNYSKQNYFLHIYDENKTIRGPVYHTDLLPFATYLNLWKVNERPLEKALQTPRGTFPEGKLRDDFKVHLKTAFEVSYLIKKFAGHEATKVPFTPYSDDLIDPSYLTPIRDDYPEQPPDSTPQPDEDSPELQQAIADLMKV